MEIERRDRAAAATDASPRDRILRAAMRCFAANGYAATTIADIEAAAGFSPRAGGTYRHFRSKEAILAAALEDEIAASEQVASSVPQAPPGAQLQHLASAALRALDGQRDLMRVLFRDLDRFPELFADTADRLIQARYREMAISIAALGAFVDADAVAAVLLGALVNFKIIQAFTGTTPAGVSDERMAAAWSAIAGAYLTEVLS